MYTGRDDDGKRDNLCQPGKIEAFPRRSDWINDTPLIWSRYLHIRHTAAVACLYIVITGAIYIYIYFSLFRTRDTFFPFPAIPS